ncbi:MAG: hypothetical protein ACRBCK_04815 [Alphaproteobacteria bacterium]
MPYLILIFGLIAAAYAFYIFMVKASVADVRGFIFIALALVFGVVLLFFAMTGRIIISLGLFLLCFPFILSYIKGRKKPPSPDSSQPPEDDDAE